MRCHLDIDEEIKMETALPLLLVAIAGIGSALVYTIAGPKIRQRIHNDTFRTRSA
jgi:hypothetical protein